MTNPEPSTAVPPAESVQSPRPRATNNLAIIAFVLSVVGFVSGLGFVAGIICGHISLSQIKRSQESGRGLAIAALVIGYVMVAVTLILIAFLIVILAIAISQGQWDTSHHHFSYSN